MEIVIGFIWFLAIAYLVLFVLLKRRRQPTNILGLICIFLGAIMISASGAGWSLLFFVSAALLVVFALISLAITTNV